MKRFCFSVSIFLICYCAFAQFPSGSSIPSSYGGSTDYSYKWYKVDVKYTNGKTEEIQTQFSKKILPLGKGFQFYIIKAHDKIIDTIRPNKTVSITRKYSLNGVEKQNIGLPFDSLWLFPVVEGKISCYYPFPEYGSKNSITYYVKKGDGKLEKYSKKVFAEMIKDNPEAVKAYKNGRKGFFSYANQRIYDAAGIYNK